MTDRPPILVPRTNDALVVDHDAIASTYVSAYADATIREYARAVRNYAQFLRVPDLHALQSWSVADHAGGLVKFATALQSDLGLVWSSVNQAVCGVLAGIEANLGIPPESIRAVPRFRTLMRGVRRLSERSPNKKEPFTLGQLRLIADLWNTPDKQQRRTALLVGALLGLRRSEIVTIPRAAVEIEDRGLVITLGVTKTDRVGGHRLALKRRTGHCPVAAVERLWETHPDGTHLLSPGYGGLPHPSTRWLARTVKMAAADLGLPTKAFSAHSLRATFVTCAWSAGMSLASIVAVTRHRSMETARGYIRPDPFDLDPADLLSL